MGRKKVKGALSDDEVDAIKQYFANNFENVAHKKVYYAQFLFCLNTGLRVGALCSLNIGDVWTGDKPRSSVTIEGQYMKGDKQQTLPLNDTAKQVVKELVKYYKNNDMSVSKNKPLWRSRQSNSKGEKRISKRSFQNKLKQINDDLHEIGALSVDLYPHKLRETFLTNVFKKTGDIYLVRDLANHADISTTQEYLSNTRDELREAVESIDE